MLATWLWALVKNWSWALNLKWPWAFANWNLTSTHMYVDQIFDSNVGNLALGVEVEYWIWDYLWFFAYLKQKLKIKFGCRIQNSNFWTGFSCFCGTSTFVDHTFDSNVGNLALGIEVKLEIWDNLGFFAPSPSGVADITPVSQMQLFQKYLHCM